MPNKTIYVKDADLPLIEKAQEQLGESLSSMFAEFLRERVSNLTPVERSILEMINEVARKREDLKNQTGLPKFLDGMYAEVEAYAEKALKSLHAGEVRKAKVMWYAANTYHKLAEHDSKEIKELRDKFAEVKE